MNHPKKIPLVLLLLFLAGCGCLNPFAPRLTEELQAGDMVITEQTTPDEVMQNFKVAYTFRDSMLYSDLLDTSFIFVYFDPNEGASGQYISWERQVDLTTTGRMFRHFQVVDLVWGSTLSESVGDEIGEVSKGFDLSLGGESGDYRLSGRATFSFRKCSDEKWRITRWRDESDI